MFSERLVSKFLFSRAAAGSHHHWFVATRAHDDSLLPRGIVNSVGRQRSFRRIDVHVNDVELNTARFWCAGRNQRQ